MARSVEDLKGIIHPPATPVKVEDMYAAVGAAIQVHWGQASGHRDAGTTLAAQRAGKSR